MALAAYRREAVPHPHDGAGFVVPAVCPERKNPLSVETKPLFACVYRQCRARPQYTVGYRERVDAVERPVERHSGWVLAGRAYRGLAAPDGIRDGERAAERLLAAADRRTGKEALASLGTRLPVT